MALRAPSLSRLQFVFAVTDERPESLRVTCAARAAAAAAAACDDDADAGRGMGVQQLEVPARVATHSWRSTSLESIDVSCRSQHFERQGRRYADVEVPRRQTRGASVEQHREESG